MGIGGEKPLDERVFDIGFHGWIFMGVIDGEGEAELCDGFAEELEGTAGAVEFGCLADIDFGTCLVRDDVGSGAAGDGADVDS